MLRLAADLHIHTVLSPCAAPDMLPVLIAAEAARKGIDMIAVCDHNSADNVSAVTEAAAAIAKGPVVIAGIEITTREEVHVLAYFATPEDACLAAKVICAVPQPLQAIAASACSLGETVDLIHRYGGIAIAAHVDRQSFGVVSQLGFLPPEVPFDGLEITAAGVNAGRAPEFFKYGITLTSCSDSHTLADMGTSITALEVLAPSHAELHRALHGQDGRRCLIA